MDPDQIIAVVATVLRVDRELQAFREDLILAVERAHLARNTLARVHADLHQLVMRIEASAPPTPPARPPLSTTNGVARVPPSCSDVEPRS